MLPVAAALAILFSVIAAVAGPAWFDRDKAGFDDPTLDPSLLGLLTLILVPVQLLLVAFAMRGFQQQWNVEVEVHATSPGYAARARSSRRNAGRPLAPLPSERHARVAELAIRDGLKSHCPFADMWVRVPPRVLSSASRLAA